MKEKGEKVNKKWSHRASQAEGHGAAKFSFAKYKFLKRSFV